MIYVHPQGTVLMSNQAVSFPHFYCPWSDVVQLSWLHRVALEKALINCQGRTPEATMASALYTDVKRKLDTSVFTR